MLLIIPSTAFFIQQQYFFIETQQLIPSPLSLSDNFVQPSGHELPKKQNGAIPYHLQSESATVGTTFKIRTINKREMIFVEAISMNKNSEKEEKTRRWRLEEIRAKLQSSVEMNNSSTSKQCTFIRRLEDKRERRKHRHNPSLI